MTEPTEQEQEQCPREQSILKIGEKQFTVDKKLLCSKSLFFKTMFQCEMKESLSNQVTVNDIKESVMEIIMEYLKTGKIPDDLDEDLLMEVIGSSHMLMIDELYEGCCNKLKVNGSNYYKIKSLNEIYQNVTLKKDVALYQSKYFTQMKQELLHLSPSDLEFLLSNTTIECEVDEIIDFLLCWGILKENKEHLPNLVSLVNMSSLTLESLEEYLYQQPLVSSSKELSDAFKETASLSHFHFICVADKEFRGYSVKNGTWTPSIKIPNQPVNINHRLYFTNDHFYALITRSSRQIEVYKLNSDATKVISSKKINAFCRSHILLINDSLYFISCDSNAKPPHFPALVFSLYLHVYEVIPERFQFLTNNLNCSSGGIFSVTGSETHIYILIPDCIYQVDLATLEWVSIPLPIGFQYEHAMVHSSLVSYLDHLYYFQLRECTDEKYKDFVSMNENRKMSVLIPLQDGDKTTWMNPARRSHHVHHMHKFRYVSGHFWEHVSIYEDFPYREFRAVNPPVSKLRRLPVIYCTTRDVERFLHYDFRIDEWQKISIKTFDYWKSISSLNYIYKRRPTIEPPSDTNADDSDNAKCVIS